MLGGAPGAGVGVFRGKEGKSGVCLCVCVFASRNQGSYAPFLVGVRLFPIKPA